MTESRSVQRRVAAQKGLPAPAFSCEKPAATEGDAICHLADIPGHDCSIDPCELETEDAMARKQCPAELLDANWKPSGKRCSKPEGHDGAHFYQNDAGHIGDVDEKVSQSERPEPAGLPEKLSSLNEWWIRNVGDGTEVFTEAGCISLLEDYREELATLKQSHKALMDALQGVIAVISTERGWGTWPRMEGSQIYTEANESKKIADAALDTARKVAP